MRMSVNPIPHLDKDTAPPHPPPPSAIFTPLSFSVEASLHYIHYTTEKNESLVCMDTACTQITYYSYKTIGLVGICF